MKTNVNATPPGASQKTRLLFALAAAMVLLPLAARADSRADAKRHFRDGMALLASGEFERGIAEMKLAYAIKPHPNVLYDIAKAYVEIGEIGEALNYFRQYVATDPEDKEQVLKVMQRLSALGKPASGTQQAAGSGAPALPFGGTGQAIDTQRLLAQLQALINQQNGGAVPASTAPSARTAPAAATGGAASGEADMFEATTVTAASRASAREIAQELSGARDSADDLFEEQIVTAGVRSSSEARAPASLTVISDEEIRLSGAATVPEILRRVPGMEVAEMNPSDTNISIRGFNRRISNKVLVLVDGRSVYQDFLGTTLWPLLDVSVQDIARIEVIRGPGSALYGANAFAGVVNIITKVGEDTTGVRAFMQVGNHNTVEGGLSAGGRSGKLSYRTTAAYDRADKWTKDVADNRVDLSSQFNNPNRSREVQRADVAATYDAGKTQLQAGGGFDNFSTEIVPLGALRSYGNVGQAGFARAEVDNGQTKFKAFWNSVRMTAGPEYWPDGLLSLRSSVRSDVIDASVQTGFDFKGLGDHHLNIGGGYRFKSVDWGYLAQQADGSNRYTEHHFNAFLQEEWNPSKKWSVILSYRIDRHPLLYQQNVTPGGLVQSPRGSVLFEFKPEQVLRLTVGSAFRAATFLESYIDLMAPVPSQPAIGVRFQGDRALRPEQMLQAELGYRGRWGSSFQPDIVVYAERVSNLITDGALKPPANPSLAVDPATGQYLIGYTGFQNEASTFLGVGAEVGGKWSPSDGVDLGFNYAYEHMYGCTPDANTNQSSCTDQAVTPNQVSATLGATAQHKANVTALWRTKVNFDLGLDAHYVSNVTWFEKSFDTSRQGGVLFTPYAIPSYFLLNGRVGYRWMKDKLETGVAFYNLLGDNHREHPFGNQIGRRVLFTAAGSF